MCVLLGSSPSPPPCVLQRRFEGRTFLLAFQVRQEPGTYSVGQETVGAEERGEAIDPLFQNSELEYYSRRRGVHKLQRLLVRALDDVEPAAPEPSVCGAEAGVAGANAAGTGGRGLRLLWHDSGAATWLAWSRGGQRLRRREAPAAAPRGVETELRRRQREGKADVMVSPGVGKPKRRVPLAWLLPSASAPAAEGALQEGTAKPCVAAEDFAAPEGAAASTPGAPAPEPEATEAEAPAEIPSAARGRRAMGVSSINLTPEDIAAWPERPQGAAHSEAANEARRRRCAEIAAREGIPQLSKTERKALVGRLDTCADGQTTTPQQAQGPGEQGASAVGGAGDGGSAAAAPRSSGPNCSTVLDSDSGYSDELQHEFHSMSSDGSDHESEPRALAEV